MDLERAWGGDPAVPPEQLHSLMLLLWVSCNVSFEESSVAKNQFGNIQTKNILKMAFDAKIWCP